MTLDEIRRGEGLIRNFVADYSYNSELIKVFNAERIKEMYSDETNGYFKILLFRELIILQPDMRLQPREDGWFKFVDETYHIENDYLHYLNVREFEIVPNYIIEKVDKLMAV